VYPYKIFPKKGMKEVVFSPITIFYGGNGSGKTTLLNIIAEKTGVIRHSAFGGSAFFKNYVSGCSFQGATIPLDGQILTSDDVFDYLLNVRYLNDGIDTRREELFEDYLSRKYAHHQLKSLEDYENWKESYDAKSKSQSQFVKERLMRNVDMYSNGESAMKYFVDHISENALYLLDEPENSLSIALQQELAQYISDSARFYGCQFILSTHSPILLSIENAVIYDLDSNPAAIRNWTELENVRRYFDFFEGHRNEFI
jgi:predicted ATPase